MASKRMLWLTTVFVPLLLLGLGQAWAADKPPTVALLGVEDPGFVFKDTELDAFEGHVEALLARDGVKVVAAKKVREFLGDGDCKRVACWNRLGKGLGSDKGLRLRIVRSGTVCTLVETLFDTAGRMSVEARTHEAPCKAAAIQQSWTKTLPRLVLEETGWQGGGSLTEGMPVGLSAEQIDFVFNKHSGDLQRCLDLQKDRDPSVVGKLRVSYRINSNGRITQVKVLSDEHREAFVAECVAYVLKSMHFPLFSGPALDGQRRAFQLGQ